MTPDLLESFTVALNRMMNSHPRVEVKMTPLMLVAVIGHLQLALRHPGAKGESSRRARRWINDAIRLCASIEPDLGSILKLGDDPACDAYLEKI